MKSYLGLLMFLTAGLSLSVQSNVVSKLDLNKMPKPPIVPARELKIFDCLFSRSGSSSLRSLKFDWV